MHPGESQQPIRPGQARIQAALDCLLFCFLTCFPRALLFALLTATFAFRGSSSNGGTRLGKHLIALHLFGLNGHLCVTIFAIVGKLRNVRLRMVTSTLTSALGIFLIASSGVAVARRTSRLLGGKAVLLGLNLRKQRVEGRFTRRGGRCGLRATLGSGLGGRLFAPRFAKASATAFFLATSAASFAARASCAAFLRRRSGSSLLLFNLAGQA